MLSVDDFVEAGLYDPEVDADTGRLDLLHWLHEQRFTLDEMVDGLHSLSLGAMVADRWLVPGERLTRDDALAASGVGDGEHFDETVRAFGFMPIIGSPPGEIGITADEAASIAVFEGLSTMFSQEESGAYFRVVGSSLGRIADAAVSLFLHDIEADAVMSGASELALALQVYEGVQLLDGFAASLDPMLRRHVLQAIERSRRSTISTTERFSHRYAIGFVDLVGFTSLAGTMQARELASFLRDFEGRAYDVVTSAGARVVKLIGDEVMFVASEAEAACVAANALMEGVGLDDERIVPRGGLAYGDMLVRGGDYYGPVVNLASRLVDEAVPQELLVTEEFAEAAPGCEFDPAGRRMVKGFADPVPVRSMRR